MISTKIAIFVAAFFSWLFLNWSIDAEHLIVGVLVAGIITFITYDIFSEKVRVLTSPKRYLWFLYYLLFFAWECILANIDGAYRVIHPKLPIKPGIVKVKTSLKSSLGLTFLANSLTLKPGTMTIDIDRENGFLYVHWAYVKSEDVEEATRMIVYRFEEILKRIFE
jgi:multicomponent Na+:H+ antiporter subunit E